MSKISIIALLNTALILPGQAQNVMSFDLYQQNSFLINPAVVGIENYIDVRLGHRSQWTEIDGAPTTYYISAHSAIGKGRNRLYAQNHMNPAQLPHQSIKGHHGLGGTMIRDQIGPFVQLETNVAYAYHLPLNQKITLSTGAALGIRNVWLDQTWIKIPVPNDQAITDYPSQINPLIKLGMWVYCRSAFLGISYTQSLSNDRADAHTIAHSGYKFDLNPFVQFTPYALIRLSEPSQIQFDMGCRFTWESRAWIGAVLRSTTEFIPFFGLNLNPLTSFSYAFHKQGKNQGLTATSHEITVSLRLDNQEKVICPQELW